MDNDQLRKDFKMSDKMTGILINKINPLSDVHKVLKKDDIILAIDGVPIGNDSSGNCQYIYNCPHFHTFTKSFFCVQSIFVRRNE